MTQLQHILLKAGKYGFPRVEFRQKGAALLLLVFLMALVLMAVLVHSTTDVEYKAERDLKTAKVLEMLRPHCWDGQSYKIIQVNYHAQRIPA
jgi:hypothetical protein